ncbi:MAG: hypothetical protein NTW38_01365 [Candidatus Aminicenantes bacterium]|nr:hypothetical protein [Candidatus Aminicenantes bacterium]
MEYLSLKEIHKFNDDLQTFFAELLTTNTLVNRPNAAQWRFFRSCFARLQGSSPTDPEFDSISKARAAQLKFEIENKLRWFYLCPGKPMKYAPVLIHRSKLDLYGVAQDENYPNLAGYCLLIRDIAGDSELFSAANAVNLKSYLERVVAESIDAEFRAYAALPNIIQEELVKWFYPQSPAMKEIMILLQRHKARGRVINNPLNPSTKRLLRIKIHRIGREECVVHTTEYWYLRWWDIHQQAWDYPYRETNNQTYILKKHDGAWKVFQNLRPSPRTSAPLRQLNPPKHKSKIK